MDEPDSIMAMQQELLDTWSRGWEWWTHCTLSMRETEAGELPMFHTLLSIWWNSGHPDTMSDYVSKSKNKKSKKTAWKKLRKLKKREIGVLANCVSWYTYTNKYTEEYLI